VNTNNGVKLRRFIVPKKVERINDHLFIDTYKSNNIKIKTFLRKREVERLDKGEFEIGEGVM